MVPGSQVDRSRVVQAMRRFALLSLVAAALLAGDFLLEVMQGRATRHHLPWLTSKDMRHFVRTVLNDSGMPIVERHYWQGHTPSPANMDEQYGDRPPEETLEVQRRYLPQGVLGTFLRGAPVTNGVPPEVRDVWSRLVAGELDSLEAVDALRDLVRTARQRQTVAEIITP